VLIHLFFFTSQLEHCVPNYIVDYNLSINTFILTITKHLDIENYNDDDDDGTIAISVGVNYK